MLYAAKEADKRWSIAFENSSVSDALSQLKELTGVNVVTNKPIDKRISSKSYKNKTIDQILMDLFRRENYVMAWYYSGGRLDSIGIWAFDHVSDMANFSPSESLNDKETSLKEETVQERIASEMTRMEGYFQKQKQPKKYLQKVKKYFGGSFVNTPGGNLTSSNNQTQVASGTKASDKAEQQSTVDEPVPVPQKWYHLEPPPMPPGL